MYEVRIHGRGGQGAVTAAELLSIAAFDAGRVAQAFPSFGSERSGAPVASFCRISDQRIRSREPVVTPDAVLILDQTLLRAVDVFQGLKPDGLVLVNSSLDPSALGLDELTDSGRASVVVCIAANDIALRHLGRPFPSAAMLGAFAALSAGLVPVSGIEQALVDRFPGDVGAANAACAREGFLIASTPDREASRA